MNSKDKMLLVCVFLLAVGMSGAVAAKIYLRLHPVPQVLTVAPETVIGSQPDYLGSSAASYTLVEFADYQCPPCIAAYKQVEAVLARHPQSLRFVFRNYPLPFHNAAMPAALMAESAKRQGCFWKTHDALFQLQGELDAEHRETLAKQLLRPHTDFQYVSSTSAEAAVQTDKQDAKVLGVHGTPTFFLCGPDKQVWRLATLEQVGSLVPGLH